MALVRAVQSQAPLANCRRLHLELLMLILRHLGVLGALLEAALNQTLVGSLVQVPTRGVHLARPIQPAHLEQIHRHRHLARNPLLACLVVLPQTLLPLAAILLLQALVLIPTPRLLEAARTQTPLALEDLARNLQIRWDPRSVGLDPLILLDQHLPLVSPRSREAVYLEVLAPTPIAGDPFSVGVAIPIARHHLAKPMQIQTTRQDSHSDPAMQTLQISLLFRLAVAHRMRLALPRLASPIMPTPVVPQDCLASLVPLQVGSVKTQILVVPQEFLGQPRRIPVGSALPLLHLVSRVPRPAGAACLANPAQQLVPLNPSLEEDSAQVPRPLPATIPPAVLSH